jgi:hypothetical protein
MTVVSCVQSLKKQSPIVVTLSGIVTLVIFIHQDKNLFPIEVTLSGILTLVSLVLSYKKPSPIVVTLSGSIKYSNFEFSKTLFPTVVKQCPIIDPWNMDFGNHVVS